MKNKNFISALLFLIALPVSSQWIVYNASLTGKNFRDISVVNENIIWTLLDDTINNIYRTTNGGLNWQIVGSKNIDYGFITAASENHAWISGIETNYKLYNTTNGGQSWQEQNYYPRNYINFIKFFDVNTGFYIADSPSDTVGFYITRNGGSNWFRSQNAPIVTNQMIVENRINALDTNLVWICMYQTTGNYTFYLLNGGLNNMWQHSDYGFTGAYTRAVFKNSLTGLVCGGYKVLITTNGGINWSLRNNECVNNFLFDFINVPGTDWVIANTYNKIMVSYDFCLNWNNTYTYNNTAYGDAKAYNSAWLSGNNGQLLHLDYNSIGIIKVNTEIPTEFELYQNYPNPFNPNTNISFTLPVESDFVIKVFDITGKEVYSVNDAKPAGEYSLQFDGANLSSGVYFYRIEARGFSESMKMILMK